MGEFLGDLGAFEWFLSVVVVGVVINLASAYLKPRVDGALSKVSQKWATRTAKKRVEREARIAKLRDAHHEQIMKSFELADMRIRSILSLLLSMALMLLSVTMMMMLPLDELGVISRILFTASLLSSLIFIISGFHMWVSTDFSCSELEEALGGVTLSLEKAQGSCGKDNLPEATVD